MSEQNLLYAAPFSHLPTNTKFQVWHSSFDFQSLLSGDTQPRRFIDSCLVVWLDWKIDESNANDQNMIHQLQCVVNTIKTFNTVDECVDFLTQIKNEKIFLILSDVNDQHIMSLIQDRAQLDSVYVLCRHEWERPLHTTEYFKMKGIFTDIEPICHLIKLAIQQSSNPTWNTQAQCRPGLRHGTNSNLLLPHCPTYYSDQA